MAARGDSPSVIGGDLTAWLHSVRPRSYVFIAARVVSDKDRDRAIRFADVAGLVCDAVGLFCFRPVSPDQPTRYQAEPVPTHVELDRVLFRACQDLVGIRETQPEERPPSSGANPADDAPLSDHSKRDRSS